MKNTCFFLVFFAVFISGSSFAQQTKIKECPIFSGLNSLVLDRYDTLTIAYTEEPSTNRGYFLAETIYHPSGSYIELPTEFKVNDMDYYCENLLFGGGFNKGGEVHGLLGRLFVPNSFDWGQNMEYIILDWITSYGYSVLITNVKRVVNIIEPQSCLNYFRFAFVGDCKVAYMGDTINATAVCDAQYYGQNWYINVFVNGDETIDYTDVTVMDNHVVAAGYNSPEQTIYMSVFDRTYPFINYLSVPGIGHEIKNELSGSKVLAEALSDDYFALANHFSSESEAGNSVKILDCSSGQPILIHSAYQIQNSQPLIIPSWDLRELKYEQSTDLLYLLHNMDYPVSSQTTSVVNEYDVTNFPSGALLESWLTKNTAYGMGLWASGGFHTVGNSGGILTIYKKKGLYIPITCADYLETNYEIAQPICTTVKESNIKLYEQYGSTFLIPNPVATSINIICQE